jgi:DNA-binding response OmpR family regulator
MEGRAQILLIEDDAELSGMLTRLLAQQAMDMRCADSLRAAREMLAQTHFDAAVLDLMLPDGSGLDMCRELRAAWPALPVLILSARGDTIDRVLGLEIGADDYLRKPFETSELVARLRALLRRGALSQEAARGPRLYFPGMEIDLVSRVALVGGKALDLTSAEFKLLTTLARTPGEAASRETLSSAVQPGAYMPLNRSVDVQVTRLRKKLSEADPRHDWIQTVRGEGYVFVPSRPA